MHNTLGRQAVQNLDFEALEMVARRQALQLAARALEQRLTPICPIMRDRSYPAPAEGGPNIMAVTTRHLKAYWDRCIWNGPTTTLQNAKADSALATML